MLFAYHWEEFPPHAFMFREIGLFVMYVAHGNDDKDLTVWKILVEEEQEFAVFFLIFYGELRILNSYNC